METKSGVLNFTKGQTIIREGDPGSEMYVVEEGEVEILKGSGASEWRLGVLSSGDFFGEMSIIDDLPRGATARALTPCRILAIDHATFDEMIRHYPEVAIRMLRRMSARMREAEAIAETARAAVSPAATGSAPAPASPSSPLPYEAPSHASFPLPEPPPASAPPAPGGPSWKLVFFETGSESVLPDRPEAHVGRRDSVTGARPDVDLTELDPHKTTSRRHARILRDADRLFVFEEIATANGTFVNGTRVGNGIRVEVKDGDWIQFGDVKTILKVA